MASGKTLEMIALTRMRYWGKQAERPARERDRALAGKKRIRARREARK